MRLHFSELSHIDLPTHAHKYLCDALPLVLAAPLSLPSLGPKHVNLKPKFPGLLKNSLHHWMPYFVFN